MSELKKVVTEGLDSSGNGKSWPCVNWFVPDRSVETLARTRGENGRESPGN